jgi:hypothetical protein
MKYDELSDGQRAGSISDGLGSKVRRGRFRLVWFLLPGRFTVGIHSNVVVGSTVWAKSH